MPDVDLSTVSGPELRSLLNTARARGQAAASYQILQEMAARRDGRPAEGPRVIRLELGDPLGGDTDVDAVVEAPPATAESAPEGEDIGDFGDDAPLYLAPAPAFGPARRARKATRAAEARAPAPAEPEPSVWDDAPEPAARTLQGLPHPGRPGFARAAIFAAGIVLGAGAGWGAASLNLGRLAPPPAAAPPADFLRTANQALPATPEPPAAAAPAVLEVVQAPAPGEPVAAGFRGPNDPAPAEVAAPSALAKTGGEAPEVLAEADAPSELPKAAKAELAKAPPAPALPAPAPPGKAPPPKLVLATADGPCAAEPTPADRTICADPQLRRLQRELRAAYGEALEAHEDRDLLRQHQLAWRDARNSLTDPGRLADLYAARIRKLHAAAEAAREGR